MHVLNSSCIKDSSILVKEVAGVKGWGKITLKHFNALIGHGTWEEAYCEFWFM